MSFSAIESRLVRLRARRGGGLSSYFGGDAAAVEAAVADALAAVGNSGRSGAFTATELGADLMHGTGYIHGGFQQPSLFTPTHYVSASATGSGNGSQAAPYTLTQAMSLCQPGWVVEVGPGIYIGPNRFGRIDGSFMPARPGTATQPIIFYARNYAALSATGRSILQHTGTVQGQGCPVLAARSYCRFYGFYIDEDQAPTYPDTGPVTCFGHSNVTFGYMRVNRGAGYWNVIDNNRAAFRFEGDGVVDCRVHDCWIENYHGGQIVGDPAVLVDASGSEQGVQLYGKSSASAFMGRITVENNYFDNCQYALTVKSIGSRWIDGGLVFRNNLIRPSDFRNNGDLQSGGVNIIEVNRTLGRNQFYGNIQVGGAVLVKLSRHPGYGCMDVDVVNNTCIGLIRNQEFSGVVAGGDGGLGSGWRVVNNIKTGTGLTRMLRYDTVDSGFQAVSNNLGFGATNWAEHPRVSAHSSLRTLSQWVAGWPLDRNSLTSDPLLQSSTWGNPNLGKLGEISPALNAGVDILNLLGNGTSGTINIGAFILPGQTDVIGIRPLT